MYRTLYFGNHRCSKLAKLHRAKERETPSLSNQARFAPFTLKVAWSGISLIKCGQALLQTVTTYKYLGVTLDGQLNYSQHVTKIIGLGTNKLKQLHRMRGFLSKKAALMVYKEMILPHLEYGYVFLHAASAENPKSKIRCRKNFAMLKLNQLISQWLKNGFLGRLLLLQLLRQLVYSLFRVRKRKRNRDVSTFITDV